MFVIREPIKDHSMSFRKDLKWSSDGSSRTLTSCTDASSCCGESVESFADDDEQHSSCCRSVATSSSLDKERISKRVRWSPTSRQRKILSHKYFSTAQRNAIWYTHEEAEQIRVEAKRAALNACTVDTEYATVVNQVSRDACILCASMDDSEIDELLADEYFLDNMAESLNASLDWEQEETARGLEDLISDDCRFIRLDVSQDAREMVVSTFQHGSSFLAKDTARCYKEMSMSAVVYARLAAVADEAAAQEIYQDEC